VQKVDLPEPTWRNTHVLFNMIREWLFRIPYVPLWPGSDTFAMIWYFGWNPASHSRRSGPPQSKLCTMQRTYWMLSIMPKIPEILVESQMERSVSVHSHRNIRSTLEDRSDWNLPFHFNKLFHCSTSLHLCREFGKGIKTGKSPIPLVWPGLIAKCPSMFFGYRPTGFWPVGLT